MIWTARQVAQAEGIWVHCRIEEAQLIRYHRDLLASVKDRMFRQMQELAFPFGLELHPADIRFKIGPVERTAPVRKVEGKWSPRTRQIELLGGQNDGVQMTVPERGLFQRFVVPLQPGRVTWSPDATGPMMVEPISEAYDFHGWDETRRIWIYKWSS